MMMCGLTNPKFMMMMMMMMMMMSKAIENFDN